jgi:hypothetical protein
MQGAQIRNGDVRIRYMLQLQLMCAVQIGCEPGGVFQRPVINFFYYTTAALICLKFKKGKLEDITKYTFFYCARFSMGATADVETPRCRAALASVKLYSSTNTPAGFHLSSGNGLRLLPDCKKTTLTPAFLQDAAAEPSNYR